MINRSPTKDDCLSPICNHCIVPITNDDHQDNASIDSQTRYEFKSLVILIIASIAFVCMLCISLNNQDPVEDVESIPNHSMANDRFLLMERNTTKHRKRAINTNTIQLKATPAKLSQIAQARKQEISRARRIRNKAINATSAWQQTPSQLDNVIAKLQIYNGMVAGLEKKKQHLFWAFLHDSNKWFDNVEKFMPYYWDGKETLNKHGIGSITRSYFHNPSNQDAKQNSSGWYNPTLVEEGYGDKLRYTNHLYKYLETRKQMAHRTWDAAIKRIGLDINSKLLELEILPLTDAPTEAPTPAPTKNTVARVIDTIQSIQSTFTASTNVNSNNDTSVNDTDEAVADSTSHESKYIKPIDHATYIEDVLRKLHERYPDNKDVKKFHDYRYDPQSHKDNFDELIRLQTQLTTEIFKELYDAIMDSSNHFKFMEALKDVPDWEMEEPDSQIKFLHGYYKLKYKGNTIYYRDPQDDKWRLAFITDNTRNQEIEIHVNDYAWYRNWIPKISFNRTSYRASIKVISTISLNRTSARLSKQRPETYIPRGWTKTETKGKTMELSLKLLDQTVIQKGTFQKVWLKARKIASTIHLYHKFSETINQNHGPRKLVMEYGFDPDDNVYAFTKSRKHILIKKWENEGTTGEYQFANEFRNQGGGLVGRLATIWAPTADTKLGTDPGIIYIESNEEEDSIYEMSGAFKSLIHHRYTWKDYNSDPENPPIYLPFEKEYSRALEFFKKDISDPSYKPDYVGLFRSISTLVDLAQINDIGDYRKYTKQWKHEEKDFERRKKAAMDEKSTIVADKSKDGWVDWKFNELLSPINTLMHTFSGPRFVPSAMAFNEFIIQCKPMMKAAGVPVSKLVLVCSAFDYGGPLFLHFIGNWWMHGIKTALLETKRSIEKIYDPNFFEFIDQPESLLLPNAFKNLKTHTLYSHEYHPKTYTKIPDGYSYIWAYLGWSYLEWRSLCDQYIKIIAVNDAPDYDTRAQELFHIQLKCKEVTGLKRITNQEVVITKPLGYLLINDILRCRSDGALNFVNYDSVELPF